MSIKPGYYLVLENGQLFGPIANDNPKRNTYLDNRIERQVQSWAKKLNQKWKFVDAKSIKI